MASDRWDLSKAHRQGQLAVRAKSLQQLLSVWRLMDPATLDQAWPDFVDAVTLIVGQSRKESAALAGVYYTQLRGLANLPDNVESFRPILRDTVRRDTLRASLDVTGRAAFARATGAGQNPSEALGTTFVQVAGSVGRHVLNGGRDTVLFAVVDDPAAIAFERVTDSSPCYFCAMLAGRGAVYRKQNTADFRPHDSCGCSAVPRFQGQDPSDQTRRFRSLYNEMATGSGKERARSFRREYEKAQRAGLLAPTS